MFLRHSFLRHSLLGQSVATAILASLTLLSPLSFAITYEITSTEDAVVDDGVCTLREAIQAINTQVGVDSCAAGAGTDVIQLQEGAEYELAAGELVIGGEFSTDVPPEEINPRVTVKVIPDDVFDNEIKVNPTIYAFQDSRIFNIKAGATLTVENLTLDGQAPGGPITVGPTDGLGGGLIYSEGGIAVARHTILQNGKSGLDGGAIYLAADDIAFSMDNVAFINNEATGNGGAIAAVGTFAGLIGGQFFYIANNTAGIDGGGIFLNGASPALLLENGTFYANNATDGGAIRLAASERVMGLNNVTIAGQDSGGGISFEAELAADSLNDIIRNSIIVGNVGGSCVGDAAAIDGAYFAYLLNEGGSCPNDQTGFVQTGPNPGDEIANNEGAADFSVLAGVDSLGASIDCPSGATGSAACGAREFDDGWSGFLPSLNDDIGAADGVPTAIDAASPFGSSVNACATLDQRSNGRDDDCDAGAIELTAAQGNIDEFVVVAGTSNELDVLANDLGDATVDCTLPSTVACLEILIAPQQGTVTVTVDATTNQPVVTYQSFVGFHGVDRFSYSVSRDVVVGGLTRAGSDVGALVNVVVEPASGLLESESIGSVSWLFLFFSVMGGLMRRVGLRTALAALMVLMGGAVQAATITVTGLTDDILSDGICSLREAIGNAASPTSSDCAFGDASGTDTILLPEGQITLVAPLQIPSGTLIDLIGKGADANQPTTNSIIDGGGVHRIFSSLSRLKLQDLVLQNGSATNNRGAAIFTNASLTLERVALLNNAAESGGAIFLSFNSEEVRNFSVTDSEFDGNTASLSGGAVSMLAQNQVHSIRIESTSFVNNSAGTTGGALDINLPQGGSLSVANATFYNNVSASGGGAIDLQDAIAPTIILNSTFVDNGAYGLDLGNIDPTVVGVRMYNSVYFDSANPTSCSSSGAGVFSAEDYNVFGTRAAAPGSCHQATQSDNSQDRAPAELIAVLGGTPVPAEGEEIEDEGEIFVPTHFAIDPADPNAGYLLDVGNGEPGELASGFAQPWARCRATDTRGAARTSGGQCDIGAYELKVATSVDDEGANTSRTGNYAIINVVANDVAGETGFIVPYAIDLNPTGTVDFFVETSGSGTESVNGSFGTVRLVGNTTLESLEEDCGWSPTQRPEDGFEACLVRYEPPEFKECSEIEDFTDTFTYAVLFNDQEDLMGDNNSTSLPGTVTVSVSNRPPAAPNVTVEASPGDVVVFPFNVEDPENIPFSIADDVEYEVKQAPVNAKFDVVDQERVYLGVGIIIDDNAGTLTYIPESASSPFNERFSISYKDACGATGTTVFQIKYPDGQASGDVLGGGSIGGATWLFVLLLLGRRRM